MVLHTPLPRAEDGEAGEDMEPVDNSPWAGTDRDYTYEEVYCVCMCRDSYRILGLGGDSTPRGVWENVPPGIFFEN